MDVQVSITFTGPWETARHYYHHDITIAGLRDVVKDRVTLKSVKHGYVRAYLNGKPCKEIPHDQSVGANRR